MFKTEYVSRRSRKKFRSLYKNTNQNVHIFNLVPRACDPREGTWGSGIIRCRKPGILAKTELRIPYQRPIRFLPEMDYPRASRSFPRIAGSGNEIGTFYITPCLFTKNSFPSLWHRPLAQAFGGSS
jgi:hypothetical protein